MTIETWTPERIDQLRNHICAGLSCSQIAAEIGVTRNAVIGKIHRLGLAPGRGASPRRSALPAPPRTTQRRALRAVGMQTIEFAAAVPEDAPFDSVQRCSLLDLAQGKCRWPISDPGKADFAFCGNDAIDRVSYCAGHARMAYRFTSRRRA